MCAEDIANIITTMTINHLLKNLKVFDMRLLIKSMKWHSKLTSKLDPNQLMYRVLMLACSHTSNLHQEYLHKKEEKQPTSNMGKLSLYLSELSKTGWTVSLDKIGQEDKCKDDYFFIVSKELDKYLSAWNPKSEIQQDDEGMRTIGKCIVAL